MMAKTLAQAIKGYNEKSRSIAGGVRIAYFNSRTGQVILRYPPTKKAQHKIPSKRERLIKDTMYFLHHFFSRFIYPLLCKKKGDPQDAATGKTPALIAERPKLAGRFVHSNLLRFRAGCRDIATKIPSDDLAPSEPTVERVTVGKNNLLNIIISYPKQERRYYVLFIFIYISVQYTARTAYRLIKTVQIGRAEGKISVRLDHFNGGIKRWGMDDVPLALLAGGIIRLKASVVGLVEKEGGAIDSQMSDEYKLILAVPAVLTPPQQRLKERLYKHLKNIELRKKKRMIKDGTMEVHLERKRRKQRNMTPEQKVQQRATDKKWRQKNPDKVRLYYRRYYAKNKKKINARKRELRRLKKL